MSVASVMTASNSAARSDQCVTLQLLALPFHILSQHQFHHDGHHDDRQRTLRIARFRRVEDLLDRLDERGDTRREHDDCDNDGAEILYAPKAEGMLAVGRTLRELRADDSDDARQRIAQVIDCVHHDSHAAGENTHDSLESR